MGLIVLAIVLSSSYVAYISSASPQYYLIETWQKSPSTWQSVTSSAGAADVNGNLFIATASPEEDSLTKLSSAGVEEWHRSFVIAERSGVDDLSIAIDAGTQHIYVVGTYMHSAHMHGFLACFNSFGEADWILNLSLSYPRSVATVNGYVHVAGATSGSRGFIADWDSRGNQLWNATWSGDATAVSGDDDGNVFVAGIFNSQSILLKFDPAGKEVWNSTWTYTWPIEGKLVRAEGAYIYAMDVASEMRKYSTDNGTLIWSRQLGWGRIGSSGGVGSAENFQVYTFFVEANGDITAGGSYSREENAGGVYTYTYSICVASFDSDGVRETNVTSPQRDGQIYIYSAILRPSGRLYMVGTIHYPGTAESKPVVMELDLMSSFIASTALAFSLASVALTILAAVCVERRMRRKSARGQMQQA
jgi:hypothetical protein